MNNLDLLNHLKTKAITQKTTNLGVFETKAVVPLSVIDEEIRKIEVTMMSSLKHSNRG